MRSVVTLLLLFAVFAIVAPTAWAGYQICPLLDLTANAPCGRVIPGGYEGRDCLGAAGCPAGQSCVRLEMNHLKYL